MCDADLMANTRRNPGDSPNPFDLKPYKEWADAPYDAERPDTPPAMVSRLVAEIERLDALLSKIGKNSDDISDSIVHYRENRS